MAFLFVPQAQLFTLPVFRLATAEGPAPISEKGSAPISEEGSASISEEGPAPISEVFGSVKILVPCLFFQRSLKDGMHTADYQ